MFSEKNSWSMKNLGLWPSGLRFFFFFEKSVEPSGPPSCILNVCSLSKSSGIFQQNPSKVNVKRFKFYCTWTSSQVVFRFPGRSFSPIYWSLILSYMAHIFVLAFIFVKAIPFCVYYSREGNVRKISIGLDYICLSFDLINLCNIILLLNKSF